MFVGGELTKEQTCTTALAIRQMAHGSKPIAKLNDLRGPMSKKLGKIQRQLKELQRYREMFGPVGDIEEESDIETEVTEQDGDEGSEDGPGTV